jgi:hypothetical protein
MRILGWLRRRKRNIGKEKSIGKRRGEKDCKEKNRREDE